MRCGAIPLLVGALLAALAACSGGSETYALQPTEACLKAKGVMVVGFDNPAPGEPVVPLGQHTVISTCAAPLR
jgi:hypothetical protein